MRAQQFDVGSENLHLAVNDAKYDRHDMLPSLRPIIVSTINFIHPFFSNCTPSSINSIAIWFGPCNLSPMMECIPQVQMFEPFTNFGDLFFFWLPNYILLLQTTRPITYAHVANGNYVGSQELPIDI
jgi:hypothetical protein